MPKNKDKHVSLRTVKNKTDVEKNMLKTKIKRMFITNDNGVKDYDDDQFDTYSWNNYSLSLVGENMEVLNNEKSSTYSSQLLNCNKEYENAVNGGEINKSQSKKIKKSKKRKFSDTVKDVEHKNVEEENRNMLEAMLNIVNCDESSSAMPFHAKISSEVIKKPEKSGKPRKNKKKKKSILNENVTNGSTNDSQYLNGSYDDDIIIGGGASDNFSLESINGDHRNSFVFDFNNQLSYTTKGKFEKMKIDDENDSLIEFGNVSFNLSPVRTEKKIEYTNSAVEVLKIPHKKPNCIVKLLNSDPSICDLLENTDNSVTRDCNSTMEVEKQTNVEETMEETIIEDDFIQANKNQDSYKILLFSQFCIGIFQQNSQVYFKGSLKVSLLHGNVEVFGYSLTEASQEMYSFDSSSLLYFKTYPCNTQFADLVEKLKQLHVPLHKIDEILNSATEKDAVLLLKPFDSPMIDFISHHLPKIRLIPKLNYDQLASSQPYNILRCMFYNDENPMSFVNNPTWNKIADNIFTNSINDSTKSITIIGGGKKSGKSTMLRYLINKGLKFSPVLVIDIDPGQSEFTICGSISATVVTEPLLGPNFTHLLKPVKSFSLALLNVADNEDRYIVGVKNLYNFCKESDTLMKLPWIVNTMGYTTSAGYQLFSVIYNIFKPSHIVEITCPIQLSKHNYKLPLTPQNLSKDSDHECQYYFVESYSQPDNLIVSLNHKIEPKTERLLNTLAYFSKMEGIKANSILGIRPFVVSLDKINILFNNVLVPNKYIMNVLNGRIIALCEKLDQSQDLGTILKYGTHPLLCFGHGLIRGVDSIKRELYILTPENLDTLMKVDTLVYGETLPDCSGLLSVPNLQPKITVPYTAPLQEGLKHSHLLQIPKRKFNILRILDMARLN